MHKWSPTSCCKSIFPHRNSIFYYIKVLLKYLSLRFLVKPLLSLCLVNMFCHIYGSLYYVSQKNSKFLEKLEVSKKLHHFNLKAYITISCFTLHMLAFISRVYATVNFVDVDLISCTDFSLLFKIAL